VCVVASSYNNVQNDRFLWHLESIMQQNYSNFRVILVDDASTDSSITKIARHLKWRNANSNQYILVKHTGKHNPLKSIIYASQKYCNFSEIQIVVAGSDELIGRQVFKMLNAVYQQ
jgi:cellulose synthase/poly-beta-1,6-N-acetylglucosamine synthase-like glycosyltransferase